MKVRKILESGADVDQRLNICINVQHVVSMRSSGAGDDGHGLPLKRYCWRCSTIKEYRNEKWLEFMIKLLNILSYRAGHNRLTCHQQLWLHRRAKR